MSSPFKKALLYLGLGPDEEYDDYGSYEEQSVIEPRPRQTAPANREPTPAEPPVHVVRPEPEPTPAPTPRRRATPTRSSRRCTCCAPTPNRRP